MTTNNNNDSSSSGTAPIIRIDTDAMLMLVSNMISKLQSQATIENIRPLPVFLGLSPTSSTSSTSSTLIAKDDNNTSSSSFNVKSTAFSVPVQKVDIYCIKQLQHRIKINGYYYLSNYILISIMTAIVVSLMNPQMIIAIGIVFGLWYIHKLLIVRNIILFNTSIQSIMTVQQRSYTLSFITIFVILVECFNPALAWLTISSFIFIVHSSLRTTTELDDISERELLLSSTSSSLNEKNSILPITTKDFEE